MAEKPLNGSQNAQPKPAAQDNELSITPSDSSAKVTPETSATPQKSPVPTDAPITLADQKMPDSTPTPKPAQPKTTPAPAPTPSPAQEEAQGGALSFSNIFNQQKSKKQDTNVMSSVLKKKESPRTLKPILGDAPVLQKSIEEERRIKLKRKLRLVQTVFAIVFLAAAGSVFYFYSELSPTFDVFGPNTTQRLRDVNENLRSVQTQLNKYRYLAAQLDLNRFSHISSDFLDKTAQLNGATSTEAVVLANSVAASADTLPLLLENIRAQLTPDIVIETTRSAAEEELTSDQIQDQAEMDLRNALLADRRQIVQSGELTTANEQDLKLIDNTIKLVGNDSLLSTVRSASVDGFEAELAEYTESGDDTLRQELSSFMRSVLASTQSDIAVVGSIKATRIDWATIMSRIENVTRTVDPTFGAGLAQSLGDGIFYTGYSFDTANNTIILSGVTRTTTADNFTLISELIEALELSSDFMNVEMRSFSKSGTFAQGFSSSFKIELALEQGDFSPANSPISLEPKTIAEVPSGVQRTP